ncbi:MAG: carboxylesterase family protein [Deltaproteobacteria bacterium]|nr:carboxylesterase family protein [Deltaproteobacteria bacterium]
MKRKHKKSMSTIFCLAGATALLFLGLSSFVGCSSSSDEAPTGIFTDSPVSGLNYRTAYINDVTDANGKFKYDAGATVTFSIGDLVLGSATGAAQLTPLSVTSGATAASDQIVNNKLILLQTLDADGDLNNGIQITEGIRSIVSANAASINFNQSTTAFRTNLAGLMTALNSAGVFSDTDSRDRTVRTALAALEHFTRSTSERIVVNTAYGKLRGYSATEGTWQFLGVPYAKPPLGDLRWRPPQEPAAWTGTRDAVAWGDQAAQNPAYQAFGEGGMSEDCLYLNITAPKNASNLPVMVWLHGGGFSTLTGNTKAFNNPNSLPTKGVILVVVNHRLGPFGYLAHPLLTAESGYGGSGNYGQMDQVQALAWVKNNIANFGGNPNSVTIFGESGGGGKVLYLMTTPKAAGLFHKAICESGIYPPDTPSLATAEASGVRLADALGATTLEQLRAKTWVEINAAAGFMQMITPNVDGWHLPDTMRNIYEAGMQNDVPFIAGMNKKDVDNPAQDIGISAFIKYLPWWATKRKTNTYAYMFSHVPANWAALGVGAYHGIELVYLFNYPTSFNVHYLLGLTGLPAGSAPATGWNATDVQVSDNMMTLWSNFAKNGIPSTAAFTWPVYTAVNDNYVEIGSSLSAKVGLAAAFE